MFVPKHFRETDVGILHDLIAANPFGILIGQRDDAPFASHIPFMLDPAAGVNGTLVAHVARNNPHGEMFDGKSSLLAIFEGPHAYISPRWYAPGDAVPTWNYAVVHAYGTAQEVTDIEKVRAQQAALIRAFEGTGPAAWTMDGQPERYIEGMLRGVTAFEMPIGRLEGKFKLSQNRPEGDRANVSNELAESARETERDLAALMRSRAD
ncbi:MAG: FMN-binding negative transcriptional regulator [Alphaproteobacteria bacterium]